MLELGRHVSSGALLRFVPVKTCEFVIIIIVIIKLLSINEMFLSLF